MEDCKLWQYLDGSPVSDIADMVARSESFLSESLEYQGVE